MNRLNRFDEHRLVGTRDDMVVCDCEDDGEFERLEQRVAADGLLTANLLQVFAPDALAEARNRGFHSA